MHCEKYRNFTYFHGVGIMRKGTVFLYFRTIRRKLCGNCAFPQNVHTMKLGKIAVFFAVLIVSYGDHLFFFFSDSTVLGMMAKASLMFN